MKPIEQKRQEAEIRKKEYEMRSLRQQLDLLELRRGDSKKERQKLLDQLEKLQAEYHGDGKRK